VIVCGQTKNSSHARSPAEAGTLAKGARALIHDAQDTARTGCR
jgi:hypothetical protein